MFHIFLRGKIWYYHWYHTWYHPKRIALDVNVPQRLRSPSSFRQKAEELSTLLPPDLQHRQNSIHFSSLPWQQSLSIKGQIATSVPGITGRADDSILRRQCSLTTIASYRLTTLSTPMDPLVEEQGTGVQLLLSLENPVSSLK